MKIDQIELEHQKCIAIAYISKELWENGIASENNTALDLIWPNMLVDEMVARLSVRIYTRDECEIDFEWYASWWQELRTKIMPKWWIIRHPSRKEIKKKERVFSAYPSIRISDFEHLARIQHCQITLDQEEPE